MEPGETVLWYISMTQGSSVDDDDDDDSEDEDHKEDDQEEDANEVHDDKVG